MLPKAAHKESETESNHEQKKKKAIRNKLALKKSIFFKVKQYS